MSSRRLFSLRRPSVLPLSNDSSPNGASTSTVRRSIATSPQPVYPDYLNGATSRGWDATVLISSTIRDVSALPPGLSIPFTQVFGVVAEISQAVKTMRDGRDRCTQLMVRVTRFLESLVDTLKGMSIDDTKITPSLHILGRNLMAIHADATQWSGLNILKRYVQRDKIMNAISIHEQNLTDCLLTFPIVTLMTTPNPPDRVERITFPGPPVLARPLAASGNTPGSIVAAGLHALFEHPAVHAVFEQIGETTQGRLLEEMGLRATSTSLGSRHAGMTELRSSYDYDVSYLRSKISELKVEVHGVLPRISVSTDIEAQVVRWGTHQQPTGNPTHQLRETIRAALQLLNEMHDVGEVKFDSAALAKKMNDLSTNLDDLGLRNEASEVQTTVVVLWREAFGPDLASSLHTLSVHLSKFGRHEEALSASEEALSLYRLLAADRPRAFHPHLAQCLSNLSVYLLKFGRGEEALKANEDALRIYRLLAADRPKVFHPDLACSLNNLSLCLSELDRHEEALEANEEALSIRRSLAADRPQVFRPYLACSLNNLSINLSKFGRDEEAFKAITEALGIYRLLAADRPKVFHPDLAYSLYNCSTHLSNFGRDEEAFEANGEALSIFRLLAADHPEVFRPDLADSLNKHSHRLSELGRDEEALKANEEALHIRRSLATDRPGFRRALAQSLRSVSVGLSKFGRHEEALKVKEEALGVYRLLAADQPGVFRRDLAQSLRNISISLSKFGRHKEALKANKEALSIYRLLAADRPEVFRPDLAQSLNNLSRCLSELGRDEQALKANEEALNIYRSLAADEPEEFRPDLAHCLNHFSTHLSKLGRDEEALKANEEALHIRRSLATDRPGFRRALAQSLRSVSVGLSKFGRHEEALKVKEEALGVYRLLAADQPGVFRRDLAQSLRSISVSLSKIGRHEEALKANEEALYLQQSPTTSTPSPKKSPTKKPLFKHKADGGGEGTSRKKQHLAPITTNLSPTDMPTDATAALPDESRKSIAEDAVSAIDRDDNTVKIEGESEKKRGKRRAK